MLMALQATATLMILNHDPVLYISGKRSSLGDQRRSWQTLCNEKVAKNILANSKEWRRVIL